MNDDLRRVRAEAERFAQIAYWKDDFLSDRITWSEEGCRILGLPADERSRAWDRVVELFHPDDRSLAEGARARARQGECGYHLALRAVRPDGDIRYLIIIIDVIRNESGEPVRAVGAIQDVTELRRTEQVQTLFRVLIDHSTDMLEIVDPDTGQFLYVNERACRVHGYSAEEYLSLRVSDFDSVLGDPVTFAGNVKRLRQNGSITLEGEHRRKDGSVFPVEVILTYARLERDYLLAVVRNISERRRREEALRGTEGRLRLAVEATGLGPWDWDLLTNQVEFSPEWKRQLGYEPEEVANRYDEWEKRLHPDDRGRVLDGLRSYLEGRQPEYAVEFRLQHKNGDYRWIYTRGVALRDATGKPTRMLGCHLDITDRKSLEQQLRQSQKMDAVGQLAGGVAHDFNNLLTAINGYSELGLRNLEPDDPLFGNFTEIKKAGERAAALTRQLLAFSRRQLLQPKVVDLNEIVADMMKMLKRIIGEDVELIAKAAPNLGHVKVDPGQIEQVIVNLAVNARDAMPDGGKLSIETANVNLDQNYVRAHVGARVGPHVMLAVTDTGTGIDKQMVARIFEPFFTTKELGKGTGLGLATVYGIVKQSGGSIYVYSEVGHGTTFKIFLPRTDEDASEIPAPEPPEEVPSGAETILLVEDDDMVRGIARAALEMGGYKILEAANGGEALLLCEQYRGEIHLLITDVVMPRMSGPELAARLAQLRPRMSVLYMSGYTENSIVQHGVLQESLNLLEKPFTPNVLLRKVRDVLSEAGTK